MLKGINSSADHKIIYSLSIKLVIATQIFLNIGWLLGGFLQEDGYSMAYHTISDLGALTSQYPYIWMVPMVVSGIVTVWFALGVLRPIFKRFGIIWPVGTWLLALSLMGLGNISDFFFPLDCRSIDATCTWTIASTIHDNVGVVSALITIATPFVLSRHMRLLDAWKDLSSKAVIFGICFLILVVGFIVSDGAYGHGYIQRLMILMQSFGIVVLALRVNKISTYH